MKRVNIARLRETTFVHETLAVVFASEWAAVLDELEIARSVAGWSEPQTSAPAPAPATVSVLLYSLSATHAAGMTETEVIDLSDPDQFTHREWTNHAGSDDFIVESIGVELSGISEQERSGLGRAYLLQWEKEPGALYLLRSVMYPTPTRHGLRGIRTSRERINFKLVPRLAGEFDPPLPEWTIKIELFGRSA